MFLRTSEDQIKSSGSKNLLLCCAAGRDVWNGPCMNVPSRRSELGTDCLAGDNTETEKYIKTSGKFSRNEAGGRHASLCAAGPPGGASGPDSASCAARPS